jgi:hypothetical protein
MVEKIKEYCCKICYQSFETQILLLKNRLFTHLNVKKLICENDEMYDIP